MTDRGRRRTAVRAAFWSAGVAVLAGSAAFAVVTSSGLAPEATVRFSAGAEVVTLPAFEDGVHVLRYEHGGTVTFDVPIANTGRAPMTLMGLHLEGGPLSLLEVVAVDPLPVRLGGGEAASVTVTARFGNCRYYHEREVASFAAAVVHGEVLGVGVERQVSFDHPLVVHSPMIVDCPDRTLARDDDQRPTA